MMVHPDETSPNFSPICMDCRACIQLPLDVYGIDATIYIQMLNTLHILLVQLAYLENGRDPDIGTLKKNKRDIFSEGRTKIFKETFQHYVNEVVFEIW